MIDVHLPANLFYPELPGGCNQYFRYGPYLHERGVQLHVHTVKKSHHGESQLEIRGIHITRYEVPAEYGLLAELEFVTGRAIDSIKRGTRKACLQPLGTTAASASSLARLWKARMRGIPSCFHFMMVPVRENRRFPGNLKEALRLRAMFSPYRKLLVCSHVMGRAFTDVAGVSPKRIEAIPNGIDLSVFSPVPEVEKRALRTALSLPHDVPIVLYVGSVIPRKGVDLLIGAWGKVNARHPQAKLVVVGSTRPRPTVRDTAARSESEVYFEKVAAAVDHLADPESVIFAGEVENIRDFYRASDLFAFASHREGLPSVVLESMACAVPCVVAPFIGLPADGEEYGVAGKHFIKSSHDPSQMAEDISRLIEDPEARATMGQKACAWIRETQEMGMAADRLADVYRQMLS